MRCKLYLDHDIFSTKDPSWSKGSSKMGGRLQGLAGNLLPRVRRVLAVHWDRLSGRASNYNYVHCLLSLRCSCQTSPRKRTYQICSFRVSWTASDRFQGRVFAPSSISDPISPVMQLLPTHHRTHQGTTQRTLHKTLPLSSPTRVTHRTQQTQFLPSLHTRSLQPSKCLERNEECKQCWKIRIAVTSKRF